MRQPSAQRLLLEMDDQPTEQQHGFKQFDAAARGGDGDPFFADIDDRLVETAFEAQQPENSHGQDRADPAQRQAQQQVEKSGGGNHQNQNHHRQRQPEHHINAAGIGAQRTDTAPHRPAGRQLRQQKSQ
ncbi:hypothetical protein SDC9_122916 [bioreactor metagenome]|uniref:Uncharacterized protein n=1 Tax=bioreactor metagenome TaxID=1076179 RepID=A0A645CG99_9ZZZZ